MTAYDIFEEDPIVESEDAIEYVGPADSRTITAADWKNVGIENQEKVEWDKKNKFKVPVSDLTDEAVQYLMGNSSSFKSS